MANSASDGGETMYSIVDVDGVAVTMEDAVVGERGDVVD